MRFIITSYTETEIHMLEGATPDLLPFSVMCSSALHILRYLNGISLCEYQGVFSFRIVQRNHKQFDESEERNRVLSKPMGQL